MGSFPETFHEPNLPWPLSEPVNGTAIDKRGEHTTARTESIPYRTHTQYDMKIVTNSADKVVEHSISAKQNVIKIYSTMLKNVVRKTWRGSKGRAV